jgi:hypothetical protein
MSCATPCPEQSLSSTRSNPTEPHGSPARATVSARVLSTGMRMPGTAVPGTIRVAWSASSGASCRRCRARVTICSTTSLVTMAMRCGPLARSTPGVHHKNNT